MDTSETLNTLQIEYENKKQEILKLKTDMVWAVSGVVDAVLAKHGIYKNHYSYDDLRQTAYVCLLESLETFDPEKGVGFEGYFLTFLSYKIKDFLSAREPKISYEDYYEDETQDVFGDTFSSEVEELLMKKASVEQKLIYNVFLKNTIVDPLEIATILSAIRTDVALLNDSLCNPEYVKRLVYSLAVKANQIRKEAEMRG